MINKIKLHIPASAKALLDNPESTLSKAFNKTLNSICIIIQGNVKRNIVTGWGMGHKTRMPFFTGKLNRSITYAVKGLKGTVGSNMEYAEMQEYGGDIVPKTAKALFIPMSSLGRKVGPTKGGGSGLEYGKDFIFSKKVTIKPKRYFERGMESSLPQIDDQLTKMLSDLGEQAGFK